MSFLDGLPEDQDTTGLIVGDFIPDESMNEILPSTDSLFDVDDEIEVMTKEFENVLLEVSKLVAMSWLRIH